MRKPIAVFATHDDPLACTPQIGDHGLKRRSSMPYWCKVPPHPGSHIDVPQDRAEAVAPTICLTIQTCTQARWVRNGSKRTPGYEGDVQRLCSLG
ncbi:MAG: hypothetical protein GDA36_12620 [Rhodobacteraceae bacterium]|nr:hypothetical protein [Paracoccaceae bacterium]